MPRKNIRQLERLVELRKELNTEVLQQLEVIVQNVLLETTYENFLRVEKMVVDFNLIYTKLRKITDQLLESSLNDR